MGGGECLIQQRQFLSGKDNIRCFAVGLHMADPAGTRNGKHAILRKNKGKQHLNRCDAVIFSNGLDGGTAEKFLAQPSGLCQRTVCHQRDALPTQERQQIKFHAAASQMIQVLYNGTVFTVF